MAEIIRQLRQDHINIAKLLELLEAQIGSLDEGEIPDYLLMFDVMCYLRRYPDLFHHPREDLIFEKLKNRDASTCPIVDNLIEEHKALAAMGAQFFMSLQAVVNESIVSRETLVSEGRAYIAFQSSHMNREEDQVFPLASKVLCEEDWVEIDMAMEMEADPVFGGVEGGKYRALYKFLTQQHA